MTIIDRLCNKIFAHILSLVRCKSEFIQYIFRHNLKTFLYLCLKNKRNNNKKFFLPLWLKYIFLKLKKKIKFFIDHIGRYNWLASQISIFLRFPSNDKFQSKYYWVFCCHSKSHFCWLSLSLDMNTPKSFLSTWFIICYHL